MICEPPIVVLCSWCFDGSILVEVDATVGEFSEGSLLLELCGRTSVSLY